MNQKKAKKLRRETFKIMASYPVQETIETYINSNDKTIRLNPKTFKAIHKKLKRGQQP